MFKLKLPIIVKPLHEKKVVHEFLKCLYADNPIKYKLKSREPDEPDVLVKLPDKEEYYELARILDHKWYNLRKKALKNSGEQIKVNAAEFGLPEKDIVESKLKNTYTTDSKDAHLLLYYDKGILIGGYPPVKLNQLCNDLIKPLLGDNSIFKTVYIFDRRTKQILWKN